MAVQLEGRDIEGLVTTLRALLRSETKLGIETYNFLLGVSNQLRDAQLTTTIFQRLIHSGTPQYTLLLRATLLNASTSLHNKTIQGAPQQLRPTITT